jgi:hypothetical protein
MKLLLDQNLSFKLCTLLSDLFPDSKPVRELGLDRSDDRVVWQHAKDSGFMLEGTGEAAKREHPVRPFDKARRARPAPVD